MVHSRSQFLRGALRYGALGAVLPGIAMNPRMLQQIQAASARESSKNILVLINLAGGNDGLNMVVPYADSRYYANRPTLAVPDSKVLALNKQLGLHPNLSGIKALYDRGKVAIVQGVGYPDPNLSHFRSSDIWQSGVTEGAVDTGWLGRFLDSAMSADSNPLKAVSVGALLPKAFWAAKTMVPVVQSLESFKFIPSARMAEQEVISAFQQIYTAATAGEGPYQSMIQQAEARAYGATLDLEHSATVVPRQQYPDSALGGELKLVSQVIASSLGTRVFMVTQGGYDDHAQEAEAHPRLMQELGDAVAAFERDMTLQGKSGQVLIMTFSEFGRRPLENASNGTDHGTAAPILLVGGGVRGGIYGDTPSLANLDNGNLRFNTDFRSVYATIVQDWFKADASPVVLGRYPTLPFIA